jgi:hypothetical protein
MEYTMTRKEIRDLVLNAKDKALWLAYFASTGEVESNRT